MHVCVLVRKPITSHVHNLRSRLGVVASMVTDTHTHTHTDKTDKTTTVCLWRMRRGLTMPLLVSVKSMIWLTNQPEPVASLRFSPEHTREQELSVHVYRVLCRLSISIIEGLKAKHDARKLYDFASQTYRMDSIFVAYMYSTRQLRVTDCEQRLAPSMIYIILVLLLSQVYFWSLCIQ